jgi:K+-sensing histidine kinase KdpD
MGLPLIVGSQVLGAVTVQSTEEAAFTQEDISTLQTMADHLAIAIKNAYTLQELEAAHNRILRQRTFEALAGATTQAIHWIGNKALPITTTVDRMALDLDEETIDITSLKEDLAMVNTSARQIVEVKERLLGQALELQPRLVMIDDVAHAAAVYDGIPTEKIEVEILADTPYLRGDSSQLARVFSNLYQNALEAKAKKIKVAIAPIADGSQIKIDVIDDGEGIPFEMQAKIWASFITTKGPNHHGMGLPSCLHVIGQHQGIINVESEVGRGTTFTIILPADQLHAQIEPKSSPANILLIDDDDQWAKFASDTLTATGKTVTRKNSAKDAADADLILIDDALASASLEDIMEELQNAGLNEKVIILAAGLTVERTTAYLKFKVKDVLPKPYTPKELYRILAQY